MKILAILTALLVAAPALASSIFLDDGGSISLGAGDVVDQLVLTDTAHAEIGLGATVGEVTLLDLSTATLSGGLISGPLEVFNQATLTIETLDTAPTPFQKDGADAPATITAADCPLCALAGTLADGTPTTVAGLVAQGGTIQVTPVPEPATALELGLGLVGLGLAGRRRWRPALSV